MANRRSLIGEVSLPNASEKVWNRISGTTSIDMGELVYTGQTDFPLQSDVNVDYKTRQEKSSTLFWSGTTFFNKMLGIVKNVSDFKILSWDPLEDDNYKYIVFPMHLVVGDNGDKGKVLFEYLCSLDNDTILDDVYIGTTKIYNFHFNTDKNCFLYPSIGESYNLDIDGSVTKQMIEPT